MQFTDAILGSAENFKQVYDVLKTGTMQAIDDAMVDGVPLVLQDRTSAVCIGANGGRASGS